MPRPLIPLLLVISLWVPHVGDAQTLVLRLANASVTMSGDSGTQGALTTATDLPAVVLGDDAGSTTEQAFIIDDSAIEHSDPGASGRVGGLEYHLAKPALATLSSSSGVRSLALSASVVLANPDGRTGSVYDIEITGNVPADATGSTSFPMQVSGWREAVDGAGSPTGKRELAFTGVLSAHLEEH